MLSKSSALFASKKQTISLVNKRLLLSTANKKIINTNLTLKCFQSISVKVPTMAESLTEGSLKSYTKAVGDFIDQDELLATIETDKIDVEVNSPSAGTITKLSFKPEDTVTVGEELAVLDSESKGSSSSTPKKEESAPAPKKEEAAAPTPAAPGKDVSVKVPPMAESITEETAAPKKEAAPKKQAPEPVAAAPAPSGNFSRNERCVKMNRMRLRIAERLKESQNTAASLTTFNEVDMSAVMEMRKLYKDEILKNKNMKFGFMGLFTKACTLAAKEIPGINAYINGDQIVYREYTDCSIAVATPKGLVTPVVRNAESLSVLEIETEIGRLGKKARDGKMSLEDMSGGTFTISNGGVFGSLYGTPIINMPQTAVLGLHGIKERPVTVNGQIVSRPMMYLALTYDHRLLDGREAVIFLRTVKELIEDPRKMLLM
ncbi:dihydrolipoamide succinyltransferase [Hanseniaspora valbyensis NRRL Y-1626]|uniref:dihydrolipoyllysine-residue succinyltransferase n=1 Tax=Hanseniaspora valbyensis NRRL Y-1626 TaxID=766949 RepID=A0A1B7TI86_9ASCO|nr:dihydrolipoamide succinyltransferase [Hanseniaspora valbyensis NRRL Y-1626]